MRKNYESFGSQYAQLNDAAVRRVVRESPTLSYLIHLRVLLIVLSSSLRKEDVILRTDLSSHTLKSVDISERQSLNNHEERERVINH